MNEVAGGYYMAKDSWNGQPKYDDAEMEKSVIYVNDCWIVDESENLMGY